MSKHESRTSLLAGNALAQQTFTEGGYHEREGYMPQQHAAPRRSCSWLYIPNSKWTWSFFLINFVQAIIGLALEGYIFSEFYDNLKNPDGHQPVKLVIPTYLSLFIFGFIYEMWLVYDSLKLKNTIQIIGLCIYNVGLLIESAVQTDQIRDAINEEDSGREPLRPDFDAIIKPFTIALPIVMAVGTVLMSLVAWKLYDEFSWSIYKNISADLRLKRRYLSYQIYISLLKFDFFFFLAFTVQFVVVVRNTTDLEFGLTIAAIPITIVLLILAAYWTRRESVLGMLLIIVIYFAALAYFFFKLLRMYVKDDGRRQDYQPAIHSLTTFAVLTIILLFVTITYAIICVFNFDKGLKPHIQTARRKRRGTGEMDKLYAGGGGAGYGYSAGRYGQGAGTMNGEGVVLGSAAPGGSRMTID